MTANSLYSNFIDAADDNGSIKNNRDNLEYCAQLAAGIVRYDLYNELYNSGKGVLYGMIGGTANSHAVNFINPSVYQVEWVGTVTHNDKGVKGNGSNGYGKTFLLLTANEVANLHVLAYAYENVSLYDGRDLGFSNNSPVHLCIQRTFNIPNSGFAWIGNTNSVFIPNNTIKGCYIANRLLNQPANTYRNGVIVGTETIPYVKGGNPTDTFYILAVNNGGNAGAWSSRGLSLISIGAGLTDDKAQKFSHLVYTLQGIKNRQ